MRRLLLPSLFTGSLALTALLSAPPASPPVGQDALPLLPRAEVLRTVGAAYVPLISDYYWLQLLNVVGGAQRASDGLQIAAYGNLATDLDPRFEPVYAFAGLNIPFQAGRDSWVNVEESNALLRKGIQALPDSYQLRFLLAHNLIFFERKYKEGADILKTLIHHPSAPPYLPQLVTRLYGLTDAFEAGISLAVAMRDSAEDEETRTFFQNRILQLEQSRLLHQLEQAAAAFRTQRGRFPSSLQEMLAAGLLRALPEDPLGGKLSIDGEGHASSTVMAESLQLHTDG